MRESGKPRFVCFFHQNILLFSCVGFFSIDTKPLRPVFLICHRSQVVISITVMWLCKFRNDDFAILFPRMWFRVEIPTFAFHISVYFILCYFIWLHFILLLLLIFCKKSVRKHGVKIFSSVFSRIRTEYGEILLIFLYSVWIWENKDQKNVEYGHFSRSENIRMTLKTMRMFLFKLF